MSDPVRDFAATTAGEWAIVNGDFGTVAGAVAVPQGIQIAVGMIQGENELDESIGLPWLDDILIKNDDPLQVRALIAGAISGVADVTNVLGADLQGPDADREASILYFADTVYSENPISGSVGQP